MLCISILFPKILLWKIWCKDNSEIILPFYYNLIYYKDLYGFTKLRIGITSGIVATIIGAPVDVIKTRVQNQEMKPNNIINGIRNQITREGIKSLYAGCGTKILRTSIGTFIFLCAYESIMKFWKTYPN